ncbi:MAG: glycosyltransferase family 4 protein [Mangrovibacterium sp.]
MKQIILITNLLSFYKVNLYNRINRKAKILVIFTGDTASMRNNDFFSGDIQFEYQSLVGLNNIQKLIKTYNIVKSIRYDDLIICGVNELTSWLCAFISPKSKNATVVESSYHETHSTGLRGLLKRFFFKRISVVYASGKAQKKYTDLYNFNGTVIITKGVGIFNIVDQPPYIPAEKVSDFIYVGRLSPEKNIVFLIETFNKLSQFNLHIVGYGLQESELKAIANENIRFHGAVENTRLPVLYKSCDAFILPSISEAWGLVVEEALNNGLPVIVSDKVGCAEEIIKENYNGLIFKSNNEKSLLDKIEKMVDVDYYNSLKYNISQMNFDEVAEYQVNCYS